MILASLKEPKVPKVHLVNVNVRGLVFRDSDSSNGSWFYRAASATSYPVVLKMEEVELIASFLLIKAVACCNVVLEQSMSTTNY